MKEIKIITFANAHNYGGALQAYALQKVLEKDNNVEIINYQNPIIGDQYKVISFKGSNLKALLKSILLFRKNKKRYNSFIEFSNKKMKLTEKIFKSEDMLKNNPPKADVYIAGSDQIWNSWLTKGLKDSYTLNFENSGKIKKISYAASIGTAQIKEEEKEIYKQKISKLDYISVREEEGKRALQQIINKEIDVVLDPTLLLERDKWEKEVDNYKVESKKYILAYVLGQDANYIQILNYLSDITGLKVIHFGSTNRNIKNVLRNAYIDGPLEFVNLIKNAEYVITNSFHATVFSCIFNKSFFTIPFEKTSSRVINLMRMLKLENRIVYNLDEFKKLNYTIETNWNEVETILNEQRQKSINWLKNAIEG